MQKKAAQETAHNGKHRRTGRRLLRALACVVVFCTVYALILPALTLEKNPECGMEEHRHTEECYTQVNTVSRKAPVCTRESLGVHTHTESCPVENGQYACGLNDYVIHTHDENCYNKDGTLWCTLPEMGEHTHTDACYAEAQDAAAHVHTDACYNTVRGELICSVPTEAHTHTEACYAERETIICTLAESEGHQHGEGCFDENGALTCGLEESEGHTHGADCYGVIRELVCTQSEQAHEHTDACYAAERVLCCELPTEAGESGTRRLICGLQQGTAHQHGEDCFQTVTEPADTEKLTCTLEESEEHKHGPMCYGNWVLSCGKEEHTHEDSCYQSADPEADLESEAVWAASVSGAALNGDWRHDVIAVAETQIGYTESSRNFITDETGTRKGYTRYGAWYGDAYGDWCAMFVSFCMNYAEIPTESFPAESSCQRWIEALKSEEYGLYREAESYTPRTGDVIFFDWDGDGIANHVGLVTELVHDGQGTATEIKTIEGNNGAQVAQFSYAADDARILGYGEMPQKPSAPKRQMSKANAVSADGVQRNTTELSLPVTDITGLGSLDPKDKDYQPVVYDPVNKVYNINLGIYFKIEKDQIRTDADYVFQYPDKVIIPPGLLDIEQDLFENEEDGGEKVGTYHFVKNGDGTYSVHVKIDNSYAANAGDQIDGKVSFGGTLDATPGPNGDITVKVDGTDLEIKIPSDQIIYPGGETNKYDIEVAKSGSYVKNGDKLEYTVYVKSRKGTPDLIDFKDVINADGLKLGTPSNITVQKGTYNWYSKWDQRDYGNWSDVAVTPDLSADGTISMQLPGLAPGVEKNEYGTQFTTGNCYKITYTYELAENQTVSLAKPVNTVTAKAEDPGNHQTVTGKDEEPIDVNKRPQITKSGSYKAESETIEWTITVNANGVNISGAELTDEMFGQIAAGDNVSIDPADGWTMDGNGIKFTPIADGKNNNTYTITYSTPVKSGWDNQTIRNKATIDLTPDDKDNKDEVPVTSTVTVGEGDVAKQCNGLTVSPDGKTGTVSWTVTLDIPASGLPEGMSIKDNVATGTGGSSTDQWMTREQIMNWGIKLNWNAGGTYAAVDTSKVMFWSGGMYWSYDAIVKDTSPEMAQRRFNRFEIPFTDGLKTPNGQAAKLSFTYNTTVDLTKAEPGYTTYYNRVDVGTKNANAKTEYYKGGVIKTDGNNKEDESFSSDETGALYWKVRAMLDEAGGKWLTLTDTLPENVLLEGLKMEKPTSMELTLGEDGSISGNNGTYMAAGSYDAGSGKIVLTLSSATGGTLPGKTEFTFAFNCRADKDKLGKNETHHLKNTVTVKTDKGELGSSEHTQHWTNNEPVEETKVIDKSGTWENNTRRLNYSIEINPKGEDLVEGTDELTLTDKLTYNRKLYFWHPDKYVANLNITLIPDTVKLYYAAKGADGKPLTDADGKLVPGTEVKGWSWVRGRNENGDSVDITITAKGVPDKTPLIFQYTYSAESDVRKGDTISLGVSNSARLEGTTYKDDEGSNEKNWKDQTSSGSVTTDKTFTFYKTREGDFSTRLEGAEFGVYEYDPGGAAAPLGAEVKTYISDSDGRFQINWKEGLYDYNKVYVVTETKAPDNYVLPERPTYYYFYFSDPNDEEAKPAVIPEGAFDITKATEVMYVENSSNLASITVNKQWLNKDGSAGTHNGGSIVVDLYRISGDTPGISAGDGSASLSGVIKLGHEVNGNNWQTFNDSHPAGTRLSFSITDKNNHGNINLSFNGEALAPVKTEASAGGTVYFYSVLMQGGANELSGYIEGSWDANVWIWSGLTATAPVTPDPGESTPYRTATLSPDTGWRTVFGDLPLSEEKADGSKVYYSYYVIEHPVTNYTTSYVNNGGIGSGTITVKNTLKNEPTYELPNTGGPGTAAYTTGGLLTLGAGALLLRRRRGRRGKEASATA